jgi:hypothetical protein
MTGGTTAIFGELWPYLAMILVGFLPNEVWRWLGLVFARGLDETSEIVTWVRAVATAILAGVIGKLTMFPPPALAAAPTAVRLVAVALGIAAFFGFRRSVLVGILVGEIALVAGMLVFR